MVALAGYLPLPISLLARLFARHPSWTLADLAAETRADLLTLSAEDSSVAAAFEVSYRHLDPARQRFFRLLGLHPGTTTDSYAAAALAGTGPAEAASLLDRLHGEGLLTRLATDGTACTTYCAATLAIVLPWILPPITGRR